MSRIPPLKSLQAFRHAAEALSFKRAAEQLYVTPTAISQQIKSLESNLGLRLFRRKTREIELTAEGEQLLSFVGQAFNLIEEGVTRLSDDPNPTHLVLSAIPSFSARFLMPRLVHFQTQESELSIRLQPSLDLASFEGNDLDLAIRFGSGSYPGLDARHLMDDHIIPVCHVSLLDASKPSELQLAKMPILADDSKDIDPLWELFLERLGVPDTQRPSRFRVSDANALLEAIIGAQGVSLLRYSLVYELIEKGVLCCPAAIYFDSVYQFYLVAPESHFKRLKVQRFERWLREEMKSVEVSWTAFHETFFKNVKPLNAES
jgi:LysR family glycine cleavage system transcriptional activator